MNAHRCQHLYRGRRCELAAPHQGRHTATWIDPGQAVKVRVQWEPVDVPDDMTGDDR